MKYTAVILAAGSGTRVGLGYNKIFYKMNDRTIIENTLDIFLDDADCDEVVLVVDEKEINDFRSIILSPKIKIAIGGLRRQDSVYSGLKLVSNDYVLIHDGARPYLKDKDLKKVKETVFKCDACILATPSTDTIKRVNEKLEIMETPPRETLYNAQTPQAFKTQLIKESYEKVNKEGLLITDDASAVETVSDHKVRIVVGSYENIKITTPADLNLGKLN